MTETDNLLSMIEDQQTEIEGLKLALKESTLLAQETTILFTASTKRSKRLEEIIHEESREHSHSCRCSLCEVWKEREDATQSTHNAPKPPEEGDCIGGEGGGCEREY
jgi:sugar diacid utilization regulator